MGHIEIPLQDGTHLTVVHLPRPLTDEQGTNVLRGLQKFAKQGIDFHFFWGAQEFVGPRRNVPARLVEDGNGAFTAVRGQLVEGLKFFGVPFSSDFGPYMMHVTRADPAAKPWTTVPIRPMFALQQGKNRAEVPFT